MGKLKIAVALMFLLHASSIFSDWQQTGGPVGGSVNAVASYGNLVYAGTDGWGVRYTTNSGATWLPTSITNLTVNCLCANNNYVYAATNYEGIMISSNNGLNWTKTSILGTSYSVISKGNIVLADHNGVFRSTNNGLSWLPTNLNNLLAYSFCAKGPYTFVSGYPSGVWVSSDTGAVWFHTPLNAQFGSFAVDGNNVYEGDGSGVFLTTDNGASWTHLIDAPNFEIRSLLVLGNKLIAGNSQGFYYTYLNNLQWNLINNEGGKSLILSGGNLFAASYRNGVFISTNGGLTMTRTNLKASNVYCMIARNNEIFAGATSGLKKSSDFANTWSDMSIYATSLVVSSSNIVAGINSAVELSTDDGANWSMIRNNVSGIHAVTSSGNAILAGETSYPLLRTINNGANWDYVTPPYGVKSLGSNGNYVYASYGIGISVSADNGASFSQSSLNTGMMNCFASNGNLVYAGAFLNGVYRSTDYGYTWSQTSLNNVSITSLAVIGQNVFAGTSLGVYMSGDNGVSWDTINRGLVGLEVESLLILNNNLYAGIAGYSIWNRPLNELLAIDPISSSNPKAFSLSQNYPNPFNPSTKIKFGVPKNDDVKLIVYDALGRDVATLINGSLNAGTYETEWNAANFPSGVYFYRLVSADFSETKKLILVK